MKNARRLSSVLIAAALAATQVTGATAAENLPPKEKFHLYLLIGQSNMAGRGQQSPDTTVSPDRILKFSEQTTWEPAAEPLHFDRLAKAGKTAGLGMSFARAMADAEPGATIGLIPCAVGGTPLARWSKGGDLYTQAVHRAQLAMKNGTLKGVLWHQGESDASREQTAKNYGERLAKMIADLRSDLGAGDVPFVAGRLGEFLETNKFAYAAMVNEQIADLPKRVPHAAAVESNGLGHKGDRLHFDTRALRELGKRYAVAMLKLQKE